MGDPFDSAFRGTERFQILRCLGVGGMGVVYEALDTERQLRVALKTIKTLDPQHLLRFKTEFRALQGVEHPNLVTLFELQSSANTWFFTMELIEGQTLVDWVRGVRRIVVTDSSGPASRSVSPRAIDYPTPSQVELWSSETLPSSDTPPLSTPTPTYDEARLRDALQQLAAGLAELHRAGKIHRDIKPSNVLATPEGRIVVLDFGLVADLGASIADSGVVGTALYMAPEQAAGRRPGPEADWYSVGVMLYEILTGKLPFDGPLLQVLQEKQHRAPIRPSAIAPCPTDLEELCMALLEPEPGMRATTDKILARLGAPGQRDRSSPTPLLGSSVFVGRNAELARLKSAYEKTRQGNGTIVVVEGPSGVGKSALVAHFTRRLVDRTPDAVILTGRYYEREAVPYRAFDGIMDAVARFLMRQPASVADAILPTDVGLLASLFPALRAVESVSRGSLRPPALDPHELRTKLFAAVRELFVRLARRRPVVLVIDDVQWSDADSRAIFAEAMRAPDAPPLLLIVTVRSAPDQPDATLRVLDYLAKVSPVEHIHLAALAPSEAHDLASKLLGRERADLASSIADEAEGHPLFIDALVRHALFADPTGLVERPATLRLDEALGATLDRLDDHARTLLELVSLSLRPLSYELARRAAGLDHAELPRAVTALRSVHLVRGARIRDEDALEPYHDRVREVVLGGLAVALRRQRHEELARVLEATSRADPEELFTHWRAAGNAERALHYGVLAASKANEVLAFDRAARLYRIAIELAPDAESKRTLGIKLGEAYAASGRGPDAAHAFLAAVPGAPSDEALDLRRRAAEQLLRSGQFEAGLAEARSVLQVVDLAMPATPRSALVSFLWNRARLAMRGKKWQEHELGAIPNNVLMRIDVCWSVAGVLSMVDTIRGANFQAIHLRLALDAGEPSRVARAMAIETGYSATVGSAAKARTAKQFAVATELCERVATPYAIGLVRGCGGTAAGLEGRWRDCYALTKEAEEIFRSQCGNVAWELSTFLFFHVYSLAFLGQLAELQERVPRILREAEERGDRYGQVAHRLALANMAWLAMDDVATARRNAESAVGDFRTSFKVEHFWQMLALGQLELYVGDADRAYSVVEERWAPLTASLLLRVELTRLEAVHLRGRVALACARDLPDVDERSRLLKIAASTAKQLRQAGALWAQPLGLLLDAAREVQQGHLDDGIATLRRALPALDAADMYLYAAAAKIRLGDLVGGDEGQTLRDDAIAWMRREKIVSPTRMTDMLAPGFPLQAPPNGGK